MKFRFFICSALSVLAAMAAVSCENEVTADNAQSAVQPAISKPLQPITEEEFDKVAFCAGEAVVVFSEEMTQLIENSASGAEGVLGGVWSELGIKSMERVFPDAGEFEPRVRREGMHRYYEVKFDRAVPLSAARRAFEQVKGVESFEKQRVCKLNDIPNDKYYSNLWAFTSPNTSINVDKVWGYTMGNPSVAVCVVDTGVDMTHEDLAWNISPDQSRHYNFVSRKSQITGEDHGTHVSGTIAGVGNNGIGVVGIAGGNYKTGKKGVTIINAQVFEGNGSASSAGFAKAIEWGADHGAVISQNSWGNTYDFDGDGHLSDWEKEYAMSDEIDGTTKKAIDYFIRYAGCDNDGNQLPDSPMKGGLVVFAAGNDGIANGVPASYGPVIAVGAATQSGYIASFSNFGNWVDICAPGQSILSTVPVKDKYAYMDGTSMACPHVSGAAALILSFFGKQGFTNKDLEELLIEGANPDLIRQSNCGPYLDCWGSFAYGIKKYGRDYNDPPVIETEYTGNYEFCHWQDVTIPFKVSDPNGDYVTVTSEIEGSAKLTADKDDSHIYNFTMLCQLVDDYSPKKVTIKASDIFGAVTTNSFTYKVLPNRIPLAVSKLPDIQIGKEETGRVIELDGLFSDPDGEPVRYSSSSSNTDVVTSQVKDGKLTLYPIGPGVATVEVQGKDHMSVNGIATSYASISFKVLIRPTDAVLDWYPNPVREYLHVRADLTPSEVTVRMYNAGGSKVIDQKVTSSAFQPADIDMRSFAPGEYRIELENNGKEYSGIIVKI